MFKQGTGFDRNIHASSTSQFSGGFLKPPSSFLKLERIHTWKTTLDGKVPRNSRSHHSMLISGIPQRCNGPCTAPASNWWMLDVASS